MCELTFAIVSAAKSGQRWSRSTGGKHFLKNREITERKQRQTVCLQMSFSHRLVLEAVGSDHSLSQVQNISSNVCSVKNTRVNFPVCGGYNTFSNLKLFLYSR